MTDSNRAQWDAANAAARNANIRGAEKLAAKFPAEIVGQTTIDGRALVAITDNQRRWWPPCCPKALRVSPAQCVCAYESVCPDHGRRHNGTHD